MVHSYKDLPTAPVAGLAIRAVLERGDARDCLLTADGGTLDDLPFGARIGLSSSRRAAQLAAARSDLIASPIRGNVETRLRRMQAGEFDALILAAAGLGLSISRLTRRNPLRTALRQLLLGGIAAAVTFAVGSFIGVQI